jgi:LPPG:FO 2-phospho-L-lactate transferase
MKVVALAGGVGGAKLVDGLAQCLPPQHLTVIVNTGDDFEHFGLTICPDLDTVCYTLAGLANPETGWGRAEETWHAFENLTQLGGPAWFHLGDRDLATHLERTRRLHAGQTLSQVTRDFCRIWQVGPLVLPMSDDPVPTLVYSDEGTLSFQDYFVRRQCQPRVSGFTFKGVDKARPAPGMLDAIGSAQLVILCPSNPWVSLAPILAIPGVQAALGRPTGAGGERRENKGKTVVAVSPLIGGKAVKGPAAKMYQELGIQPSSLAVARQYGLLLSGFVLDKIDIDLKPAVAELGLQVLATETYMKTPEDRRRLAQEVLEFSASIH